MTWLIISIVAIAISLLIRGIRAANRRQQIAEFQSYASTASPTFLLEPGESTLTTVAARDLGAVRRIENDAIKDDYPSSYPLVTCTSTRLVVQMSLNDRTTDLAGSFPVTRVDLRRRIGEQFTGTDRRVSSCEWPWQSISSIAAESESAALLWENERGSGAVMLTFVSQQDQAQFVSTALGEISAARARVGIAPSDATPGRDNTEYLFPGAQVICGDCGSVIDAGDQFCTGCGIHVFRLENADS